MSIEAILRVLRCPTCGGQFVCRAEMLACAGCGLAPRSWGSGVQFNDTPEAVIPSATKPRGPDIGTAWRQSNWAFYQRAADALPSGALVLDIGAGRGDLKPHFARQNYVGVDIFPYPEIDIVGDVLTQAIIADGSADAVLSSNVLEHVSDAGGFLRALARMLRPGGRLYLAVPFLIKLHQIPVDMARYTHYHLADLVRGAGLQCDSIHVVYTPWAYARWGMQGLRNWQTDARLVARTALWAADFLLALARRSAPPLDPIVTTYSTFADVPGTGREAWPAGYQLVLSSSATPGAGRTCETIQA
jgi:SAM-dependent methyltransferase